MNRSGTANGSTAKDVGLRCAICKELVAQRAENKAFPFCSPRCQTIDLGHWLDGDYRLSDPTVDRDFEHHGD